MSKHLQSGPVTVEGKEISSRNATLHGGASEKLIVAGERQSDFDALLNGLLEEYAPATEQARHLVEDAALARWFLWRRQRAYSAVEAALYAAQSAPELWTPENYHQLALVDRYKTAAERALQRSLRNLDAHRRAELAGARATDFLEQRQESQWKAAHAGFDRPTVVQDIRVTFDRYGTTTEMKPTNAAVLRQLGRPAPFPVEQVYRKFLFPQGMPPEYYSFTSREEYRKEKNHTIEHPLTTAMFRKLAQAEQVLATGHALPNPEGHFVP